MLILRFCGDVTCVLPFECCLDYRSPKSVETSHRLAHFRRLYVSSKNNCVYNERMICMKCFLFSGNLFMYNVISMLDLKDESNLRMIHLHVKIYE